MEISNNGYPIFKGLQKPLEFMGIRGRFLIWIAGAIGVGFAGFLVCSFLIGKLVGIIFLFIISVVGYLYSFIFQQKGLHNKKKHKGVYVVTALFSSSK